jgi:cbb3-type cytochrome c oxidase subunit III
MSGTQIPTPTMHKTTTLLAALAAALLSSAALADAQKGGQLSASCAHCHGTDGNSSAQAYPNLAGQTKEYVYAQIKAFKEGKRVNSQMSPMVGILSDEDMQNLADFYNSQQLMRRPVQLDEALVAQGKKLAEEKQCAACHQPGYKGQKEFPRLARQKLGYIAKQLKEFRDGVRTNDNGVMSATAKDLTDEQIQALAQYLASL